MKTTLIISTYNWPEALELVLLSVENQTVQPDEVIIADDGSTKDVFEVLKKFKVKHIWHKDDGFRKTVILNKAINSSSGTYIIQTDGDCILHPNFVKDHIRLSKENTYLYGSRVNISEEYLSEMYANKNIIFNIFSKGISKRTRTLWIPFFSSFYKQKLEVSKKLRGCNISYWKKDFISVNGYNEDMTGWGREDSELFVRMNNKGVNGRRIRYSGIVYHIWHNSFSKHNLNKNDLIQKDAIDYKISWCSNGVDKY
ncbi:MAG: glycosyl transferase [Flavobacterium sp.]|nr:MAG: glycosyl transferase [Flavobacterium sp.]